MLEFALTDGRRVAIDRMYIRYILEFTKYTEIHTDEGIFTVSEPYDEVFSKLNTEDFE